MFRGKAKRLLSAVFALALCASITGCGETAPADETPSAPPEANSLVFAVVRSDNWISSAVEDYNAANPEMPVELVRFQSTGELLRALNEGLEADMYFAKFEADYGCDFIRAFWDASIDLTDRLDTELAPNLQEALTYGGELRYVPYDFEIEAMAWTLGGTLPETMAEANTLAAANGDTLFPDSATNDGLAEVFLYPYICGASGDARSDILGAVYAHVLDPGSGKGCAYRYARISNDWNFGLDALEKQYGTEYTLGIPGAGTAGVYVPGNVIGITVNCEDADAAWAFLSRFMTDELQLKSNNLPASASALDTYIDEAGQHTSTYEHAVTMARDVIENTTLAAGMNLRQSEQDWFVDYINSPQRQRWVEA